MQHVVFKVEHMFGKKKNILVTSGIVIMVNNKVYSFQQIENLSKYKNKTIYS